jgi:hypothetical protein
MKRPLVSIISSRSKKVACTVSAAALMLGVSSAATVGLHFQVDYCTGGGTPNPSYSGWVVTSTTFGVPASSWENLYELPTGYQGCSGPLGYETNEVIDTETSTNGLNPLPSGSISLTWFGPTMNYAPFGGYSAAPPNYYEPGGGLPDNGANSPPYQKIYSSFIRDGLNFGPPGLANNSQPGWWVDITGMRSLFPSTPFVVETFASADSTQVFTNVMVIDLDNLITNTTAYPNSPPVNNTEGTQYYQGTGGGLSTACAPFTNTDHLYLMSAPPQHLAGGSNHCGTISGFIITDKPVVSMSPQSVPLAEPGDAITLSAYAIGVPPLSYQWRLNGRNIPGATTLTNSIAALSAANAGDYDLVVSNAYGVGISQVAVVGEVLNQSSASNVVYDSNPDNAQHDGVNMGATWEASASDGTITRTGVMSFVAEATNGISVPDNSVFDGTNGTITFWMQSAGTDQSASGNNGAAIYGRTAGAGASGLNEFLIYQEDNSGNLTLAVPNGFNGFSTVANVSESKWHFVALTFSQLSSGGSSFYIDGALDSTNNNSGSWTWPSGQPTEIGYTTDNAWRDYNGLLDDVRYYSAILSSGQIQSIFTSGNTNNAAASAEDPSALQMQFNFTAAPGSAIVLTWTDATAVLQSAPTVSGPWTPLTGAASPYTVVPTGTQQYFRYSYTPHPPQSWVSNPYLM